MFSKTFARIAIAIIPVAASAMGCSSAGPDFGRQQLNGTGTDGGCPDPGTGSTPVSSCSACNVQAGVTVCDTSDGGGLGVCNLDENGNAFCDSTEYEPNDTASGPGSEDGGTEDAGEDTSLCGPACGDFTPKTAPKGSSAAALAIYAAAAGACCPPSLPGTDIGIDAPPDAAGNVDQGFSCYGACGPSCDSPNFSETGPKGETLIGITVGNVNCWYNAKTYKSAEGCRWHDDCYRQCDISWPTNAKARWACTKDCDALVANNGLMKCGADYSNTAPFDVVVTNTNDSNGRPWSGRKGFGWTDLGRGGLGDIRPACWDGTAITFSQFKQATAVGAANPAGSVLQAGPSDYSTKINWSPAANADFINGGYNLYMQNIKGPAAVMPLFLRRETPNVDAQAQGVPATMSNVMTW
jgi:hypothetical protein